MAAGRRMETMLRYVTIRVFRGEKCRQGVPRRVIGGIFVVHGSDPGDSAIHEESSGGG
ncbi:hypothetical protein DSECCO2_72380 [anaerobic digester metagenome]